MGSEQPPADDAEAERPRRSLTTMRRETLSGNISPPALATRQTIGIHRALKFCEKDNPQEDQVAAMQDALKAIKRGRQWYGDGDGPLECLVSEEVVDRCKRVADAESARLPQGVDQEKIARLRFPRNRSERLLRAGATMEDVATQSAYKVLEQWTDMLRPFASPEQLPHFLSLLVHEEPEARVKIPAAEGQADEYLLPLPHPTPADDTALGAALRRVTPLQAELADGQPWEWLQDLSKCFKAQEELDVSWPYTAERRLLRVMSVSAGDATPMELAKIRQQQMGHPLRRAPLAVGKQLRTASDFAWSTFQTDRGERTTGFGNFVPQVLGPDSRVTDTPGPGHYNKPPTRCRSRGHFPAAGRLRTANGEASLSQAGRFVFPKGSPFNMYRAIDNNLG